jgi:hypothetical protein
MLLSVDLLTAAAHTLCSLLSSPQEWPGIFNHIWKHLLCDEYEEVKQSHYRPGEALKEFQEVEAPRFQDNWYMKVLKLSALFTGRLYPPGNIPGTHFC